jgi:hypothetical protein
MTKYTFKRYKRMARGATTGMLDAAWTAEANSDNDAMTQLQEHLDNLDLASHFAVLTDEKDSFLRFWSEGKPRA